ncbi:O-antigen ligase family protein [Candidatus Peregrinibacteria bacterium]|nr:O-antigen ligase family protein [Candidatus Peregrinibacteria bacterium]
MKKFLFIVAFFILLSPVSGELVRFSVFGFDLLPADILLPILFVVWGLYKFPISNFQFPNKLQVTSYKLRIGGIGKAILVFIWVAVLSLLLNSIRFPMSEMARATAYFVRLAMYMGLYFVVYDLSFHPVYHGRSESARNMSRFRNKFGMTWYVWIVVLAAFLLSILGFLQLKYFPSFLDIGLDLQGWDPHDYRLLSTWFDPNYVAGFLAFAIGLLGTLFFYYRERWVRAILCGLGAILIVALYLTYSRSGYLALAAVLFVWTLFRSRRLLIGLFIFFVVGMLFSARFQERVGSAWYSGVALIGLDSQYALDPTAELRVRSWQHAIEIIQDHPWIGAGYNRYPFEVTQRGYLSMDSHAVGGSDSSLLTIWATTGIFGLLAYLGIFVIAAQRCIIFIRKRYPEGEDIYPRLQGIGMLAASVGLLIHSVFVNSLLLPWMMIYLWSGLGALEAADDSSHGLRN